MASNEVDSDLRRNIEARQGRVITQTIVRPTTTFTAYVTLGSGPPGPGSPHVPPTTSVWQPAPTIVPAAPTSSSSSQLTSEQIGAILGSVFGFILLLLILCTCLSLRRRRRIQMYSSSTSSEEEVIEVVAGPGGDPWTRRPGGTRLPGVVPPPTRIPPTPRHTTYRQTRHAQIRGVRRYP